MKNTKFKKGNIPHNKGVRKFLDLDLINNKHWNEEKSIIDISKELGVSDRLIRLRLKENALPIRANIIVTDRTKSKIIKTQFKKGKKSKEFETKRLNALKEKGAWNKGLSINDKRVKNNMKGLLENRKYQVIPVKDTSIEKKIQIFLNHLGVEYQKHYYIKDINHSYQSDIYIPSINLIIECYGTYWHNYSLGRDIDIKRCNELRAAGYKVLVLWENEIKVMSINDFQNALNKFTGIIIK